jgi:hypothetical protein
MTLKRKRKSRAKPKGETMAKKNKAEHEAEGDYAEPATGAPEQFNAQGVLPPPDPPVVPSEPQPPPTGYEVDETPKGAQPEDTAPALPRELELLQVGTRGEGPAPEEPTPPPIEPPPEIP